MMSLKGQSSMPHVYHPESSRQLQSVVAAAPQGILITGSYGMGLGTAAQEIAGQALISVVSPTDAKGNIDTEKGVVRIAQIRGLYEQLQTASKHRETVIIEDADTMGQPAQNAFLKLLEEPRTNLQFILTAHDISKLLPTIRSRVQQISLRPITTEQTLELIANLGVSDAQKQRQILFIGSGRPAELTRLATNEAYFSEQSLRIVDARLLLQGTPTDKLLVVNRYHGDRPSSLALLSSAQAILAHGVKTKPARQLITLAGELAQAYDAIAAGGNIRLHLLACVL